MRSGEYSKLAVHQALWPPYITALRPGCCLSGGPSGVRRSISAKREATDVWGYLFINVSSGASHTKNTSTHWLRWDAQTQRPQTESASHLLFGWTHLMKAYWEFERV